MERLSNILRRLEREVNISVQDGKYTYIGDICILLSWKYPCYTLTNFIMLNYFFWLSANYSIQIVALIFAIALLKFHYRILFGTQINPQEFSSMYESFQKEFRTLTSKILLYRNENPTEFCVVVSVFFLTLIYIGHSVTGEVLSFILLWFSFLIPLVHGNITRYLKEKLEQVTAVVENFQGTLEEEDLMPLPIDTRADDNDDLESLGTDRTADSVTNSLISGISSMPSFLDAEDNQEILEEDLIPINSSKNDALSIIFGELSSDSESELRDIHFKESQLNRESSSEDEGAFEDGLLFEDSQNKTNPEPRGLVGNIVDYVISAGGFQLPESLNNATFNENQNISRESSTSEDDFEMIDVNELKQ